MTTKFWTDRKVFLTGHTGFKGSWLSLWLQKTGCDLVGYSLDPPTQPSLFQAAGVAEGMTSIKGDVRDVESLTSNIHEFQPEIIIHMAAQALVKYAYANPLETYSTNIMGTVNVLEAVRRSKGVKVIIIVTSDKCYDNKGWIWGYRESDPMGGYDPYSSSKGCAELVTFAYQNSYFHPAEYQSHGVALASVRAGNVIGGGDWAKDRLIPDIMNAIMKDQAISIRSPNAVRPWQHVLEPLSGYLALAECLWEKGPEFCGAWNFGPNVDDARPVSWIVDQLTKRWNRGTKWEMDATKHPHEDQYLKLDCTKANTLLHWFPRLSLSDALNWIVEWYHAYQNNQNMRQITEAQIERFEYLE